MWASLCCAALLCAGCSSGPPEVTELKHYPLDSLEGVIRSSDVELDGEISADGGGSLRITASEPLVVNLFETGDLDVENGRLDYQARLRTEDLEGQTYLEMWCHFPGIGEAFSRGMQSALSGSNDWTSQEIPFFLKEGENPDNVKLNLVVTGTGTVWIDDIRLTIAR
ncbi:MAG: hypothetical protein GF330_04195 [Candidatus Eisenbacteria bacterium]|nr:hypothetical protein [Candidatus Eisenbacteria bacterium]